MIPEPIETGLIFWPSPWHRLKEADKLGNCVPGTVPAGAVSLALKWRPEPSRPWSRALRPR